MSNLETYTIHNYMKEHKHRYRYLNTLKQNYKKMRYEEKTADLEDKKLNCKNLYLKEIDFFRKNVRYREVLVEYIQMFGKNIHLNRVYQINKFDPKKKNIIIVIESPHKFEFVYQNNKLKATGSLNDKARENIQNLLHIKLEMDKNAVWGQHNVLVVNFITYPLSFGLNTDLFRSLNFIECLNDKDLNIITNFTEAIKKSGKPEIVLNCASNGTQILDVQDDKVKKELSDLSVSLFGQQKETVKEIIDYIINENLSGLIKVYKNNLLNPADWR